METNSMIKSKDERLRASGAMLTESRRLVEINEKLITEGGGRREFEFCGEKFVNFRDVFYHPGYDLIALNLPAETVEGARLLEIGCGTGCIGVVHYLRNKSKLSYVLATDINQRALENTEVNFERYAVPGEVRYSDIFENIREDEKFDLIFWHAPYYISDPKTSDLTMLDRAMVDPEYEAIGRFIAEARGHLRPGGRAIFGFGSDYGFVEILHNKASKANSRLEKIWGKKLNVGKMVEEAELWQVLPIGAK